jgi:hypothetical protein
MIKRRKMKWAGHGGTLITGFELEDVKERDH